jgi:hypothetical protein
MKTVGPADEDSGGVHPDLLREPVPLLRLQGAQEATMFSQTD